MKKIVTSILGASLLAGALYAAGNTHMGDHMHEGKMMKEMHKECMAFFNRKAKK